jgi:hypothetical protein
MQSVIFGSFGGESVISGSLVSPANRKEVFEGGYEVRFFVLLLSSSIEISHFPFLSCPLFTVSCPEIKIEENFNFLCP